MVSADPDRGDFAAVRAAEITSENHRQRDAQTIAAQHVACAAMLDAGTVPERQADAERAPGAARADHLDESDDHAGAQQCKGEVHQITRVVDERVQQQTYSRGNEQAV